MRFLFSEGFVGFLGGVVLDPELILVTLYGLVLLRSHPGVLCCSLLRLMLLDLWLARHVELVHLTAFKAHWLTL